MIEPERCTEIPFSSAVICKLWQSTRWIAVPSVNADFQMTLQTRKILEEGIFVSIAMLSLAYSGRKTWMNSSGSTRKLYLQEYLQHSFDLLTTCIVDGDSNVAWKLEGELRLVLHYIKVQEFKPDETKPKHRKGEQQHGFFFHLCLFKIC